MTMEFITITFLQSVNPIYWQIPIAGDTTTLNV